MMEILFILLACFCGFMSWLLLKEVKTEEYGVATILYLMLFCFFTLIFVQLNIETRIKEIICQAHPTIESCIEDD